MNHEDAAANQTIASYLRGELTETERATFEEHFIACRTCSDAVRTGIVLLGIGGVIDSHARDAVANDLSPRDPEVADVLDAIKQRLDAVDAMHGRERDRALHLVETYAAPYALVLFYEVGRLDSLIDRLRGESPEK
jgi:anti-sigma factor RsiW